tara:strand:+ start:401 stop:640 length:240 start_codon:yes stop_codon:yes gene_type:complete
MDKTELLSLQFGVGASGLQITAGMPSLNRVDIDILKTDVSEIDHEQVHSLISEIMKDLLAKGSFTREDSCSNAKMPESF